MKTTATHVDAADAPPSNLDAERCLLGCVLSDPACFDDVANVVTEAMFFDSANATVWRAFGSMNLAPETRDSAVLLGEQLSKTGDLGEVGGPAFIATLIDAVPHAFHVKHYARLVAQAWQRRELRYAALEAAKAASDPTQQPEDVFSRMLERAEASITSTMTQTAVSVGDALARHLAAVREGQAIGFSTGFHGIDAKLGGLKRQTLTVVAARPGCGKTALAGAMAMHLAAGGIPVLYCSLEMPAEALAERALANVSGTPAEHIRHPERTDDFTQERLEYEASKLTGLPFWIDDTPSRTVAQIIAGTRAAKRRYGVEAVFIDYLGLLHSADSRATREQAVSSMTRALRGMARELGIPVVLLCQLNRAVEARTNKIPQLSDLRESGSIEQDADAVLLLHRPPMYDPELAADEAVCLIAKNRAGETGPVPLRWIGDLMAFRNFSPVEQDYQELHEAFTGEAH